jgi:hypothetical protein
MMENDEYNWNKRMMNITGIMLKEYCLISGPSPITYSLSFRKDRGWEGLSPQTLLLFLGTLLSSPNP